MVIVAGGGIGGLSAAYYLAQKYAHTNLKIILLEASKRCGGWIQSTNNSDSIFEAGPRSIRPKDRLGANTLNLMDDIGLTNKIISLPNSHPAALNRLIYANNKLNVVPSDIRGIFKATPPFSKSIARYFINDLFAKAEKNLTDDSLYNFTCRRFGKEIADYAMSSMLCGICAGDAKEISVKFLLKRFFELEQKHGSVIIGALKDKKKMEEKYEISNSVLTARNEQWNIYSLEGGLEQLSTRLSLMLDTCGVQTLKEHKIQQISFSDDNKKVSVKVNDNTLSAQHLFSCIPAFELAPLLKNDHPQLSNELEQIPFVDVAVVNLQFKSAKLAHQAFGFLVPPIVKLPILGVIFDSCLFPHQQQGTVLTAMMGGKWFKEYFGDNPTEEYVLDVALKHIGDILGIHEKPDNFKVNISRKCIPQYIVGHYERVERIQQYIKKKNLPISLCGNSYNGVGINDVILSSKVEVDNVNLVE